jgi:phosphopantothenoylcysteine synthetase/decarboxylase
VLLLDGPGQQCGDQVAAHLPDFLSEARELGRDTCVIATPAALKFMDLEKTAMAAGRPVRYDYKQPDEPDAFPAPDAMVIAPATFNSTNKWAHGSSDTLALGVMNEAIGLHIPIIAVPFPSTALAQHPLFWKAFSVSEPGVSISSSTLRRFRSLRQT